MTMPQTPPEASPRAALCVVDGGGTGTRLRLHDAGGAVLGEGRSGPSSLTLGVEQAWRHIGAALAEAARGAGLARTPAGLRIAAALAGFAQPRAARGVSSPRAPRAAR